MLLVNSAAAQNLEHAFLCISGKEELTSLELISSEQKRADQKEENQNNKNNKKDNFLSSRFGINTQAVALKMSEQISELIKQWLPPLSVPAPATAALPFDPQSPLLWEPLIQKLSNDGLDEAKVRASFAELGINFSSAPMGRKILELYGLRYGGNTQLRTVASDLSLEVDSNFAPVPTSLSLAGCQKLISSHSKLFDTVKKRYGVPAQTIVALLLVETNLGQNLGSEPAFHNLASMALSNSTQHVELHLKSLKLSNSNDKKAFIEKSLLEKANWAYEELKSLFLYAEAMEFELMKIPGSMYGAIGICQFMPSNIAPYGVDGDGDGKVDLFKLTDAVHSVANYLRQNGWRDGADVSHQLAIIRTYNHDNVYAYTVQAVAGRLAMSASLPQSKAVMGTNPLNLVRAYANPAYKPYKGQKLTGKNQVVLKPLGDYRDILGINKNPKPLNTLNP